MGYKKSLSSDNFENFLDIPACPFRHVERGNAHCGISTDPLVTEIDPLTCFNCQVPSIIAIPRCRFLSIGTALKPYRGEGKVVVEMACRELGVKLYDFKPCTVCPYYNEIPNVASEILASSKEIEVDLPITKEQVEAALDDLRKDYLSLGGQPGAIGQIRCWRFPEGYCRKDPIYTHKRVTVYLAKSARNDDMFREIIVPAIRNINLLPFRISEGLDGIDGACGLCENIQEGEYFVFFFDEWSSTLLFLTGIAYGLGRKVVIITRIDSPVRLPLLDHLGSDVISYENPSELGQLLQTTLPKYKV